MDCIDNSYLAGLITGKIKTEKDGFEHLLTVHYSTPSDWDAPAQTTYHVAQHGMDVFTTTQTSDGDEELVGTRLTTELEEVLKVAALDERYNERDIEVKPSLENKIEEGRVELPQVLTGA